MESFGVKVGEIKSLADIVNECKFKKDLTLLEITLDGKWSIKCRGIDGPGYVALDKNGGRIHPIIGRYYEYIEKEDYCAISISVDAAFTPLVNVISEEIIKKISVLDTKKSYSFNRDVKIESS